MKLRFTTISLMFLVWAAGAQDHQSHHRGHHRFDDAERWAKVFEDPERDEWQRPSAVLGALELEADQIVVDLGSATGYFSVRMAPEVERVWAVDIEATMVSWLNARAREESIPNLFSILGTASDPLLPEAADLVLIVDTYHHIENRSEYLEALMSDLKPGGVVAVVDFLPGDLPIGPKAESKLSAQEVEAEFAAAGYRRIPTSIELPYQYMLRFTPELD